MKSIGIAGMALAALTIFSKFGIEGGFDKTRFAYKQRNSEEVPAEKNLEGTPTKIYNLSERVVAMVCLYLFA